jgi:hypothetical protein
MRHTRLVTRQRCVAGREEARAHRAAGAHDRALRSLLSVTARSSPRGSQNPKPARWPRGTVVRSVLRRVHRPVLSPPVSAACAAWRCEMRRAWAQAATYGDVSHGMLGAVTAEAVALLPKERPPPALTGLCDRPGARALSANNVARVVLAPWRGPRVVELTWRAMPLQFARVGRCCDSTNAFCNSLPLAQR